MMKLLFDLVQSLTKDEKRLYNQHKRQARFQKIYDEYLNHNHFNKDIDKKIVKNHFSDVSRPFYSMQKRSLLDDIVTVLLSYSNLQNPRYNYHRNIAKAQLLSMRRNGELALQYLKQAEEAARPAGPADNGTPATDPPTELDPFRELTLIQARKNALANSEYATYEAYEALLKQEQAALLKFSQQDRLEDVKRGLYLLYYNRDKFSKQKIKQKAEELMSSLQQESESGQIGPHEEYERLQVDALYHEVTDNIIPYHKKLASYFKELDYGDPLEKGDRYYHILNLVLRSALRVGDFLLISGLIYRTNRLLDQIPEPTRSQFLPDYYETAALYHFFENDLPQAMWEIEALLKLPNIEEDQIIRCVYYYVSILVAAHLPAKGQALLRRYRSKHPRLDQQPGVMVLESILAVDNHQNPDEISMMIDQYKNVLRKSQHPKNYLELLQMIQSYVDKKQTRVKEIRFFPQDWEEILRVDLWLLAKQENKFYYNLMIDEWQNRKQVFNL